MHGAEPGHTKAYYEAVIEDTRQLNVSDAFAQSSDQQGPLTPGRWLVQLVAPSDTAALCWVHVGEFEKTVSIDPGGTQAGPGPRRIPLSGDGVTAFEYNVLQGYNDRIGAIMDTGGTTATLLFTRISTQLPSKKRG